MTGLGVSSEWRRVSVITRTGSVTIGEAYFTIVISEVRLIFSSSRIRSKKCPNTLIRIQ
ncbi:hypothetical protein D3C76_1525970 [compost metagenome]